MQSGWPRPSGVGRKELRVEFEGLRTVELNPQVTLRKMKGPKSGLCKVTLNTQHKPPAQAGGPELRGEKRG